MDRKIELLIICDEQCISLSIDTADGAKAYADLCVDHAHGYGANGRGAGKVWILVRLNG